MHTSTKLEKISLALLPLWWGLFHFFTIRLSEYVAPFVPLFFVTGNFLVPLRTILVLPVLFYFFKNAWQKSLNNKTFIFGYQLPLGNLWWYIGLMVIGLILKVLPLGALSIFASATIYGATLEELICRSFFIQYDLKPKQFLWYALLSSAAFSLMHWCYLNEGYCVTATAQQFFNFFNHFIFGFTLSAITYKTKKLEPAILVHMLSNGMWALGSLFALDQTTTNTLFMFSGFITTLVLAGAESSQDLFLL